MSRVFIETYLSELSKESLKRISEDVNNSESDLSAYEERKLLFEIGKELLRRKGNRSPK